MEEELWAIYKDGRLSTKDRFDTDTAPAVYESRKAAERDFSFWDFKFHTYEIKHFTESEDELQKQREHIEQESAKSVKIMQGKLVFKRTMDGISRAELASRLNVDEDLILKAEQDIKVFGNLDYSFVGLWAKALNGKLYIGDKE